MIATIAVIAEKKKVQRSYGNHSPVIAATTIAEIVVAAIAGEWFHMIAMIAAIAEVFFFSAIAAITAMVAIIWKPGFNLIMAYFKRKDCLQRNLYLNCVSL